MSARPALAGAGRLPAAGRDPAREGRHPRGLRAAAVHCGGADGVLRAGICRVARCLGLLATGLLLAACAGVPGGAARGGSEAFIRTYYDEVFNRRNLDWIRVTTRPDVVGHGPGIDDRVDGVDEVIRFSQYVYVVYDDYRLTVDDVVSDGDHVVVRATVNARHRPTGRPVRFFGQTTYRLEDGLIAEYWRSYDRLDLYDGQLGGWRP